MRSITRVILLIGDDEEMLRKSLEKIGKESKRIVCIWGKDQTLPSRQEIVEIGIDIFKSQQGSEKLSYTLQIDIGIDNSLCIQVASLWTFSKNRRVCPCPRMRTAVEFLTETADNILMYQEENSFLM